MILNLGAAPLFNAKCRIMLVIFNKFNIMDLYRNEDVYA